jgi:halocyanin-like protein
MDDRTGPVARRRVLQLGALLGTAAVAGCTGGGGGSSGGGSSGDEGSGGDGSDGSGDDGGSSGDGGDGPAEPSYDGWLDDAPNYDGSTVDRTDADTVTVAVGAGNGLLFDPPAIRVTTGTTVVWEWTGKGGQHNVQERDGAFESELASAEGATYERTFDEPGVVLYFCLPHQAVGMKGAVAVVDG